MITRYSAQTILTTAMLFALILFTVTLFAVTLFTVSPVAQASSTEPPTKQVMTQGLNHLGLTVTKLEQTVHFFSESLGWTVVGGDPSYPAKFITDGEIFLTLWQVIDPLKANPFNRKSNVGLHHLALTVASFKALDELHRRFKQLDNVVIEFAPEFNGGGPTKHMMIREPSGNRIEFAHNPGKKIVTD